ncbi:hypothetical protein RB601_003363 [Gaeumannomyces tritici]
MGLEVIYVTRHGFRSSWTVDPSTGKYTATIRSPTGIANDPALTAHGLDQARELGRHLLAVEPPIERIYSSPFYRCLQTIEPFARAAQAGSSSSSSSSDAAAPPQPPSAALKVRVEPGVAEWFGAAPFAHPAPAPPEVLAGLFPDMLDGAYRAEVVPPSRGESVAELHDRVALAAARIIGRCDAEGARAVVVCTHAAAVIALGRVLTGRMPDDVAGADDFGAFTCGLSVYRRRAGAAAGEKGEDEGEGGGGVGAAGKEEEEETAPARDARATAAAKTPTTSDDAVPVGTQKPGDVTTGQEVQLELRQQESAAAAQEVRSSIPRERVDAWRGGRGVGGGWICESNSDCSFLSGGCERGWSFAGEESFPDFPAVSASSVREERRTTRL